MSSNFHADAPPPAPDPVHNSTEDGTSLTTIFTETFEQRPACAAALLRHVLNMQQCDVLESFLFATPLGNTLDMDQFEVLRGSEFLLALADTLIGINRQCTRHKDTNGQLKMDVLCQEVSRVYLLGRYLF